MDKRIYKLCLIAIFAAICYISFAFIKIDIPLGGGAYTSIHFGNIICVLCSLLFGPIFGSIVGSVGMGIGDLTSPLYVPVFPKTVILKTGIALITGFFAFKVFKINDLNIRTSLKYSYISVFIGMLFNIFGETVFGYLYYRYILNQTGAALTIFSYSRLIAIAINSFFTIIIAPLLYVSIRNRFSINKIK